MGTGEVGLRSLSALLGVLLVLATAELGRRLHNETTGLAAAFVASLAPFQVYYSQEARMYILVALETTLAVLLFWWFVRQEERKLSASSPAGPGRLRWLPFSGQLLVLIWAMGLYTHYAFALVTALLTLLYLGWLAASWRHGRGGQRLLRWVLLLALTAGFCAPWLPVAVRQLTTWPSAASTVSTGGAITQALTLLSLGPAAARPGRRLVAMAPAGAGRHRRAALAERPTAARMVGLAAPVGLGRRTARHDARASVCFATPT